MTREEFLVRWRHEFGGMVLDALTCGLHGPQASLLIRQILQKIDTHLSQIYHDLPILKENNSEQRQAAKQQPAPPTRQVPAPKRA